MGHRRLVVAQTRLAVDPAGIRPSWAPRPGGTPPPHPGREIALPVGVVRWNNPAPTLTVVVKLTLSFGPEAERQDGAVWAEPAAAQTALSGTRWDGDPSLGKLVHPTDFVPFKQRADVLLAGHAFAPLRPSSALVEAQETRIEAKLSVDRLSRAFLAVARGSTDRIPLAPGHLMDREGVPADPTGPIASPLVVEPRRWHDAGFDFTTYNAASVLQRPPAIEPDAIIELLRLSPRDEERTILLPNLSPRVFAQPPESATMVELDMDCDTLLIDTDAETCTLLFRGDMPVESVEARRQGRLVVSLEYRPHERDYWDILRELPRGLFHYAIEADDVKPGAPPVPARSAELTMARYETWGHIRAPLPTVSLATYTVIGAELAERREPRAAVLRRHGLDEDGWTLEERGWAEILAEHGAADRAALADEAGRLSVEAQDRLAEPGEEERSLAEFARVSVLVERLGTTPGLAQAKLSLPAWLRMGRRFRAMTARDPAAKAELERLLTEERRGGDGGDRPQGDPGAAVAVERG